MPCRYCKKGHIKSAFERSVNVGGESRRHFVSHLRTAWFANKPCLSCKQALFGVQRSLLFIANKASFHPHRFAAVFPLKERQIRVRCSLECHLSVKIVSLFYKSDIFILRFCFCLGKKSYLCKTETK